ncbi:fibroblast growth factor receptor homolog 1-like isoform X2 [Planococcus citri]|uniref:fibroblast growth factor receptor homolog 1-like isoform X2 n=1 Tax=Planococcus citri TaxID=170843 RepID=UPI0031F7E03E
MKKCISLLKLTMLLWILNLHSAKTTSYDSDDYEDICNTGAMRFNDEEHDLKFIPEIVVCPRGGSIQLECHACGSRKPDMQWYKNGKSIRTSTHSNQEMSQNNTILKIKDCTESDSAKYTCKISLSLGGSWYVSGKIRYIVHLDNDPWYSNYWLHLISVSILIGLLLGGFVIYQIQRKVRTRGSKNKVAEKSNVTIA